MTNLDGIFKSRDITLPTKVHLVKAMVFPVVMYGCGRTPPIPRSALEKDPRPGPLFEGNPVGEEGTSSIHGSIS